MVDGHCTKSMTLYSAVMTDRFYKFSDNESNEDLPDSYKEKDRSGEGGRNTAGVCGEISWWSPAIWQHRLRCHRTIFVRPTLVIINIYVMINFTEETQWLYKRWEAEKPGPITNPLAGAVHRVNPPRARVVAELDTLAGSGRDAFIYSKNH
ncbi:hypothetical protein J6590_029245 [Homalodisca vitripennis]|nr:hypothetical protein J6590_029245 [Homalodisca vitripennis]